MTDPHGAGVAGRVRRVLAEEVAPALGLETGGVELVALDGGMAQVRLRGGCVG